MFPLIRLSASRTRYLFLLGLGILGTLPASADVRMRDGVLNQGTRWETPYFVQQSDEPGPTVILMGGIHGDEPAGAAAAEQIRHWPICRGTLAVLPRANPPALAAHSRNIPGAGPSTANLNRNFPKKDQPKTPLDEPARAIWNWIQTLKPDWVIDLHEAGGIRGTGSKSVGSSIIVSESPEVEQAAKLMLEAVNGTISEKKKWFVRLAPPIDGSLARAAAEHLHARTMILETSFRELTAPPAKDVKRPSAEDRSPTRDQPLSRRVRQHRIMVCGLLKHLGMIDPAMNIDRLTGRDGTSGKVRVALYDARGTGGKGGAAVERILRNAGMQVFHVGAEEIAGGTLADCNLVVVPGGGGRTESDALGEKGRQKIREFVEGGGAYLGICAGAYLCVSGYDWGLKILNAKAVSPLWRRGTGTVKMELTPRGREILGNREGLLDVHYANGPIITRDQTEALPDYEILAYYRSEKADKGTPAGVMTGSPAIAAGRCGKGRVVFVSPHPEQTPALEDFIRRAATWATSP
jgi:glutamine amidotransferase-like uncharacterized protein